MLQDIEINFILDAKNINHQQKHMFGNREAYQWCLEHAYKLIWLFFQKIKLIWLLKHSLEDNR